MKRKLTLVLALVAIVVLALTLTACGGDKEYTVNYAKGEEGATGTAPASVQWIAGVEVTVAQNPFTYAGHVFKGWSDGSTTYQPGSKFTMPEHEVTLTAVWETAPSYTLSYSGNGAQGSVEGGSYQEGANVTIAAGTALSREGYIFGGWTYGGKTYQAGDTFVMPNKNVTLNAYWTPIPTYTLSYGAGSPSATGTGIEEASYKEGDTVTVAQNPYTRLHYNFVGWRVVSANDAEGKVVVQPGDTFTMPAYNVSLTAKWESKPVYTMTYKPGEGAEGEDIVLNVESGATVIGVDIKDWEISQGYFFSGWKLGETVYAPGSAYELTSDIVVVAQYEQTLELYSPYLDSEIILNATKIGDGLLVIFAEQQGEDNTEIAFTYTVEDGVISILLEGETEAQTGSYVDGLLNVVIKVDSESYLFTMFQISDLVGDWEAEDDGWIYSLSLVEGDATNIGFLPAANILAYGLFNGSVVIVREVYGCIVIQDASADFFSTVICDEDGIYLVFYDMLFEAAEEPYEPSDFSQVAGTYIASLDNGESWVVEISESGAISINGVAYDPAVVGSEIIIFTEDYATFVMGVSYENIYCYIDDEDAYLDEAGDPIVDDCANMEIVHWGDSTYGKIYFYADGTCHILVLNFEKETYPINAVCEYSVEDGVLTILALAEGEDANITLPAVGSIIGNVVSISIENTLLGNKTTYNFASSLGHVELNFDDGSNNLHVYYPIGSDIDLVEDFKRATREGYSLVGYEINGYQFSIEEDGSEWTVGGSHVVIKYIWEQDVIPSGESHTVTYKAGEGTGTDYVVTEEEGLHVVLRPYMFTDGEATLPNNDFTREGYVLVGWTLGGEAVQPGQKLSLTEDIEIIAVWAAKVTISYGNVANANTNYDPTDVPTYRVGQTVVLPYESLPFLSTAYYFSKSGYILVGWTSSDDVGTEDEDKVYAPGANYVLKGNVTFTAVWTEAADLSDYDGTYVIDEENALYIDYEHFYQINIDNGYATLVSKEYGSTYYKNIKLVGVEGDGYVYAVGSYNGLTIEVLFGDGQIYVVLSMGESFNHVEVEGLFTKQSGGNEDPQPSNPYDGIVYEGTLVYSTTTVSSIQIDGNKIIIVTNGTPAQKIKDYRLKEANVYEVDYANDGYVSAVWTLTFSANTVVIVPDSESQTASATFTKQGSSTPEPAKTLGDYAGNWYGDFEINDTEYNKIAISATQISLYSVAYPDEPAVLALTADDSGAQLKANFEKTTGVVYTGVITFVSDTQLSMVLSIKGTDYTYTLYLEGHLPVAKHTVTFDPNNEDDTWTAEVVHGQAVAKPETDPVHSSKAFLYWALDGAEYNFSSVVNEDIELTAKYGFIIKYVVGEGAVGSIDDQSTTSHTASVLGIGSVTKEGYVFKHWTDGTDIYKANDIIRLSAKVTTLTAVWEAASSTYSVTFAKGYFGATGDAPTMEDQEPNAVITLPANTFARDGYDFAGWQAYVNGSSVGDVLAAGASYTVTSSVEFRATWAKHEYNVTFKVGEGTYSSGKTVNQKPVAPATAPSEEGQVFLGWYDGDENKMEEDKAISADTIYTAVFAPAVANSNFVGLWSNDDHNLVVVLQDEVLYGVYDGHYAVIIDDTYEIASRSLYNIYYEGKVFSALATLGEDKITLANNGGLNEELSTKAAVPAALVLADIAGVYNRQGANVKLTIAADSVKIGTQEKSYKIIANYLVIDNGMYVLAVNGSSLEGWVSYSDSAVVFAPSATYTISFSAVDATGTMENVSVNEGDNYTLPACGFTKEGWTFYGWSVGGTIKTALNNVSADAQAVAVFQKTYTGSSSDDLQGSLIVLDNGKAIVNGSTLDYTQSGNVLLIEYFYVELDNENGSYVLLDGMQGQSFTAANEAVLTFDGKGGVTLGSATGTYELASGSVSIKIPASAEEAQTLAVTSVNDELVLTGTLSVDSVDYVFGSSEQGGGPTYVAFVATNLATEFADKKEFTIKDGPIEQAGRSYTGLSIQYNTSFNAVRITMQYSTTVTVTLTKVDENGYLEFSNKNFIAKIAKDEDGNFYLVYLYTNNGNAGEGTDDTTHELVPKQA